ncbi:hypothetical protein [Desulfobulbus sp.]|uniref:hypothetical protein n=1 Tax=Desulfobulbus sp. TaxID=895 RepID=UPI0027B8BE61|nr:hypothetical protein [Desulfobulbus sp.]
MSENDAILMGALEIAKFMRISPAQLSRMRAKYPEIPIHQETPKAQLCADKEVLAAWQRKLYAHTIQTDC